MLDSSYSQNMTFLREPGQLCVHGPEYFTACGTLVLESTGFHDPYGVKFAPPAHCPKISHRSNFRTELEFEIETAEHGTPFR